MNSSDPKCTCPWTQVECEAHRKGRKPKPVTLDEFLRSEKHRYDCECGQCLRSRDF